VDFRIADTFTDSLARLTGDEQKAVKTTAFDLQLNPTKSGMSFHKLEKARDKNFWSVRAGSDIRLIVPKTPGSLLICYVDHHEKAYDWAERRKLLFPRVEDDLGYALHALARAAYELGEHSSAATRHAESLPLFVEVGDRSAVCASLTSLARVAAVGLLDRDRQEEPPAGVQYLFVEPVGELCETPANREIHGDRPTGLGE